MKKFLGFFIFLLLINLSFIASGYCWDVKDRNEYLSVVKGDDGDLLLKRISLDSCMRPGRLETSAFAEAQWNMKTKEWEKITLGVEIGKYFYKWLYLGQSLQLISGQMLDFMYFDTNNNSIDSTTRIAINIPIVKDISLLMREEYSTNLEKGLMGEYCETIVELNYNFKKTYTMGFGWRHTDRIHECDTDYVSTSLTLNF